MKMMNKVPMYWKVIVVLFLLLVLMNKKEGFKEGITASVYNPIEKIYYFFDQNGNYFEKPRGKRIKYMGENSNFAKGMPKQIDSAVFSPGKLKMTTTGPKPTGKYYFFGKGEDGKNYSEYSKKFGSKYKVERRDAAWKEDGANPSSEELNYINPGDEYDKLMNTYVKYMKENPSTKSDAPIDKSLYGF